MNTEEGIVQVEKWVHNSPLRHGLIAVSGGSCSGKTTLAKELLARMGTGTAEIIYLDDYFLDISDEQLPRNRKGEVLFDVPDSYDQTEFINHVFFLTLGQKVRSPRYDMDSNQRLSAYGREIRAKRIIIADGLFAINILRPHFPEMYGVYVETEEEVQLGRRIARDKTLYGIPEEMVRRVWTERVQPCFEMYVETQKRQANLVITT